jgi:hypothetical protein
MQNGIAQGIQYCSREKNAPTTRGDVQAWIDDAPEWLTANLKSNLNPITGKRKADAMMD